MTWSLEERAMVETIWNERGLEPTRDQISPTACPRRENEDGALQVGFTRAAAASRRRLALCAALFALRAAVAIVDRPILFEESRS